MFQRWRVLVSNQIAAARPHPKQPSSLTDQIHIHGNARTCMIGLLPEHPRAAGSLLLLSPSHIFYFPSPSTSPCCRVIPPSSSPPRAVAAHRRGCPWPNKALAWVVSCPARPWLLFAGSSHSPPSMLTIPLFCHASALDLTTVA